MKTLIKEYKSLENPQTGKKEHLRIYKETEGKKEFSVTYKVDESGNEVEVGRVQTDKFKKIRK